MYALHLPSRHVLVAALAALVLALLFVMAGDVVTGLDGASFSGGGATTEPTPVPPPTWATDPLSPPTILLTR